MNVLVACEESQRMCTAFREKGHKAYSCDLQECSGGHPEWHIKGDVFQIVTHNVPFTSQFTIWFQTQSGTVHKLKEPWDLIIIHPPCTDISSAGARWFEIKRKDGRQKKSLEFVGRIFTELPNYCKCLVIENPRGIISGTYVKKYFPELCKKYGFPFKPTQTVQPWQFGEPYRKTTDIWIIGPLAPLVPSKVVQPRLKSYICKNGKKVVFSQDYIWKNGKNRSKTYAGIAKAAAEQWG